MNDEQQKIYYGRLHQSAEPIEASWVCGIVLGWIASITHIETLREWIEAAHARILELGGKPRFGVDTHSNKKMLVDGRWYRIRHVAHNTVDGIGEMEMRLVEVRPQS